MSSLRLRWKEQTCGHSGAWKWWDEWEISIDMYTIPRVKQIASGKLLYSMGSSAPSL